ncbi:SDR family NAD(P)-dependent oxidoreductase [Micromonospora sp. NBC_01412]|uniref:SDR family NAD(P)-dependent oxidoreductase n=1 Tax=Micromonospora sp. NBC_01412 TaxID=2903590 RepID=UPI0032536F26
MTTHVTPAQPLDLAGQTCIITGAAQGIGEAEARLLAGRGAAVLCVDRVDPNPVVDAIRDRGGTAHAWHGDITQPGAADDIVAAAHRFAAPVTTLVNNAGMVRDRMIYNLDDAEWDSVLAVNLTAPFRLCRAIARHWRNQPAASDRRIINTSSESGLYGNAGQSNYAAAKAGLVGLTLTLAAELDRLGVCVNAIAPRARTPMSEAAFGAFDDDDPLSARHVASLVAWLASPAADDVTGQVFVVAGVSVRHLGGWSTRCNTTQPDQWSSITAAAFHASLFEGADARNVPGPISELFTTPAL